MSDSSSITPEQFKQVLEVSRLLAVTTDLNSLFDEIARHCCAMLNCERASIFLHEPKTDELWTTIAVGSKEIRVPAHSGIVGFVFKSNRLFHCREPYKDSRFNPEPDRRSGFVTRSLLTAPMVDLTGKPVGVIQAVNKISRDSFSEADESLIQLLADQAGVAMQRYRLQQEALAGAELRKEMDLAKTVQQALIPKRPPEIAGVTSIGWTLSASITGGDSFDLWKLADGRLGIFLGDASGHGIAPALVVSQARTLLRAMGDLNPDPHEMLSLTNARLSDDLEDGRFVTAFVGILDQNGLLNWSSAGHGPVLAMRTRGGPIETLNPPGPPLGVMDQFLAERCAPIQFSPGGTLLVMSDGIFEAFNPAGKQFGVENVHAILRANPAASPADLLKRIRVAVHDWQGKPDPVDDQTLVIAQLE
jgi:phosphoserine phosphatase RsbU/P